MCGLAAILGLVEKEVHRSKIACHRMRTNIATTSSVESGDKLPHSEDTSFDSSLFPLMPRGWPFGSETQIQNSQFQTVAHLP